MNQLSLERRAAIVSGLVDGMSIRGASRAFEVEKETVLRLQRLVGRACAVLHDRMVQGVHSEVVEVDELWTYVQKKANTRWVYTAIALASRLLVAYRIGARTAEDCHAFLADLRQRVHGDPEIHADGFGAYPRAIREQAPGALARLAVRGQTNHVERSNLTFRNSMARLRRATTAGSKSEEHLGSAIALHVVWYNFCRLNEAVRTTPAVAAGLVEVSIA